MEFLQLFFKTTHFLKDCWKLKTSEDMYVCIQVHCNHSGHSGQDSKLTEITNQYLELKIILGVIEIFSNSANNF